MTSIGYKCTFNTPGICCVINLLFKLVVRQINTICFQRLGDLLARLVAFAFMIDQAQVVFVQVSRRLSPST
jgi:hypothetical protein